MHCFASACQVAVPLSESPLQRSREISLRRVPSCRERRWIQWVGIRLAYKFGVPEPSDPDGGVNSLKGGIHALAVDPEDGAVYVVYGAFDDELQRDQIKIVRVTSHGGDVKVGDPVLVSQPADRQAALPAVAVTADGPSASFTTQPMDWWAILRFQPFRPIWR